MGSVVVDLVLSFGGSIESDWLNSVTSNLKFMSNEIMDALQLVFQVIYIFEKNQFITCF